MVITNIEAKITVAKLLEVSYSKNKKLTKKILLSKGPIHLTIDDKGNATLSGKNGTLIFNGNPALTSLGAKIKTISITLKNEDDMNISYKASIKLATLFSVTVSGRFDLEELITSCSGLLCKAARALKGKRHPAYEQELKQVMGVY